MTQKSIKTEKRCYKANNINEAEKIYTILTEFYPNNAIDIQYDYDLKYYILTLTDKDKSKENKNVPLDFKMEVIYGDSVTADTPILTKNMETGSIEYYTIENIVPNDDYMSNDYGKQTANTNLYCWCPNGWNKITKVIRHMCEKPIYRIITQMGAVDVTEDHSLITKDGKYITPLELKDNVNIELLHSYPNKIEYNFVSTNTKQYRVTNKLKGAKLYGHFMKSNNVKIEPSDTGAGRYNMSIVDKEMELSCKVISVTYQGIQKDYVYDLQTEQGCFLAGIGSIVVKNTDSIFIKCKFNRDDYELNRKDTFKLSIECGNKLTQEVFDRPPIEMEFEKIFQPFILLTKKRYIANKYEDPKNPLKLKGVDAKGIALTRRDYCQMVKKCYKDIIDIILTTHDMDSSITVFKNYISDLLSDKIQISDLVVSAMLAKSYKSNNLPHVYLAEKLKARHEEVQVGDRIPYIFIETETMNKNTKKYELAEDPEYAKQNKLKYNKGVYLEQLAKPILGFYKVCLDQEKLDQLIEYVNTNLELYKMKKLKPSDFTFSSSD